MITNEELLDSIIVDCNNSVKELATGQFLAWCAVMTNIVQKLAALKNGMKLEAEGREKTIKALKDQLILEGYDLVDYNIEDLEKILANGPQRPKKGEDACE